MRGFFNTCRHRAHELLQVGECTNERSVRCPYHGWTYGLDGALHAAVRASHAPGFDPSAEGLVPARVELWQGFVFVNPDGEAPTLAEWLGDMVELTAPYPLERLRVARSHSYELAANWKIAVENYHECYHCPRIHPELCRVSPPDSGGSYEHAGAWVGGNMELGPGVETMSLDGKSRGRALPRLEPGPAARGLVLRLLPEPAPEHPPRLRHDPPPGAALGHALLHRVPMALRARVARGSRLRPRLRGGLLGPHEQAGLGGGGERAARASNREATCPAPSPPARTRSTTSSPGWREAISKGASRPDGGWPPPREIELPFLDSGAGASLEFSSLRRFLP